MSTVAITPCRDADFEAVTEIWLEGSRSMGIPLPVSLDDLRARWPRELAAGWQVHVARDGGKVVGSWR